MNDDDLSFLIALVKQASGISLTPEKKYLLESRLQGVARSHSMADIGELVSTMRRTKDKAMMDQVVEAMTTNETMFFRDTKPFEQLKSDILPHLLEHKKAGEKLRFWSAACSNGQEPYSLVLTFLENQAKLGGHGFEILATDIAPKVIKKAGEGHYSQFEVQRGMPITMLLKYFTQGEGNSWTVKDDVKKYIQFKVMNLMDSFLSMGKLDMILVRNVLIYFDDEMKADIVNRMHSILNPGGILMVGSSESVTRFTDKYEGFKQMPGVFQKAA